MPVENLGLGVFVTLSVVVMACIAWAVCEEADKVKLRQRKRLEEELQRLERLEHDWRKLLGRWQANQIDPNMQREVAEFVKANPSFADAAYQYSLVAVAKNKNSDAAKVFALNTGRYSAKVGRECGAPTIYDEQAIQNDIQTRSL